MPLSTIIGLIKKIDHVWLMVLKDFTIKTIMVGIMTLETGPSIGGHNLMCLSLKWLPNNCGLSKNPHRRENGNSSKQILYKNFTSASNTKTAKTFCNHCAHHTIVSKEKSTKAFCNYCLRHGHISFECPLKNASNLSKVAWVLKRTN